MKFESYQILPGGETKEGVRKFEVRHDLENPSEAGKIEFLTAEEVGQLLGGN